MILKLKYGTLISVPSYFSITTYNRCLMRSQILEAVLPRIAPGMGPGRTIGTCRGQAEGKSTGQFYRMHSICGHPFILMMNNLAPGLHVEILYVGAARQPDSMSERMVTLEGRRRPYWPLSRLMMNRIPYFKKGGLSCPGPPDTVQYGSSLHFSRSEMNGCR